MIKIQAPPSSFAEKLYKYLTRSSLKFSVNSLQTKLTNYHGEGIDFGSKQFNKSQLLSYVAYIKAQLKTIIKEKPEALQRFADEIARLYPHESIDQEVKAELKTIFSWENFNKTKFGQEFLIDLLKEINAPVCPYCNRNFTSAVKINSKKIVKPAFDHFFSRDQHPFFGLSLYNLIPSCTACNTSLKRDEIVNLRMHSHPYLEGFDNDYNFELEHKNVAALLESYKEQDYSIKLKHPRNYTNGQKIVRCIRSARLFRLAKIYNSAHKLYAIDVLKKCRIYSPSQLESSKRLLKSILPTISEDSIRDEMSRFIFSNQVKLSKLSQNPLAKLTRDILRKFDELTKWFADDY
ncbi:MAG: hypothetical protein C0412_10315 [Flavobacterium sp.]|nr:hypothetical protein [Flavobacterium sp.]